MKKIISYSLIFSILMSVLFSNVNFVYANEITLLAFPGAEGGGMYTQGARTTKKYVCSSCYKSQ